MKTANTFEVFVMHIQAQGLLLLKMFKDFSRIGINKIGDLYENDGNLIQFEKLSQLGILP